MSDIYVDLIQGHWPQVAELYNAHADKRPVMLIDVQEGEIHAFPYDEFVDLLDEPSRKGLAEQYQRAIDNRQMVLFVRDVEHKILQSYSLALEE